VKAPPQSRWSGYLDHRSRPAEDEVRIAWCVARGQQVGMPHLEAGLRGVTAGALPDRAMRVHVAFDASQNLEVVQPVRLWRSAVHPCVGTYDLCLKHRVAVMGEPSQVAWRQGVSPRRARVAVAWDVTKLVTVVVLLDAMRERVMCRIESVVRGVVPVQVTHWQPQSDPEDHAPRHDAVGHRESVCVVAASDHRTKGGKLGRLD
jgi:hypothetical protein